MATKMYTTSKEVYQNYRNWSAYNISLSSTDPVQFLLKSGPDLDQGLRKVSHVRERANALESWEGRYV